MSRLENSPLKANILIHILYKQLVYFTKKITSEVFFFLINCLSTAKFEHGAFKSECHWITNHGKTETPASLALLVSPVQHKQYSDNVNNKTVDYFLLVIKRLLDCVCFTDKQQLHVLFRKAQSTYFGIHFQLVLV
jgi:hypothetical protein